MTADKSNPIDSEMLRRLNRQKMFARVFLITSLFFCAATALLSFNTFTKWKNSVSEDFHQIYIDPEAPFSEQIKEIIDPLRYSGLDAIDEPDSQLIINFDKKTWLLENMRRIDENGEVTLDESLSGLCGELAAYTHQKILPFFKDTPYTIKFMRVAQSGFFMAPNAAHYILLIVSPQNGNSPEQYYILDPSLRRYGPIEDYNDYIYYESSDRLAFVENRSRDIEMNFGTGIPLLIRRGHIFILAVGPASNYQMDEENFSIKFIASKRYDYTGRSILRFEWINGEMKIEENEDEINPFLSNASYQSIRKNLFSIVNNLEIISSTAPERTGSFS